MELEKLPPKHEARTNPALTTLRSEIVPLLIPPLHKVVNAEDVIFEGAEPATCEQNVA